MIYLVVVQPGGLFGAYLDEHRAHREAAAVAGVVAEVPIAWSYRVDEESQT